MLFIYYVHKEGWDCNKILDNFADVYEWFLRRGYFSDSADLRIYKQKISFFHHTSSFLTIFWFLLHCFHSETYFAVNLYNFYNGDTGGILAFHKSWIAFLFSCQIYYTLENCKYCVDEQRKEQYVCWPHC